MPTGNIADNAVGSVMADEMVNKVIVGSDRNCANGDFANKIGTYQIAVLAEEFGLPFFVLTQPSDKIKKGDDMPIEIRNAQELLTFEGKKVFKVDLLRSPSSCRSPSTYQIEAAANDEVFIINGEKFEAQIYCLGWNEGESVIFIDGSEYGACASASLFNVDNFETCDVWCE